MTMNGRFLLDTNIVIALFARESSVQARLTNASEIFVPAIVLGELYYGAYKSARVTLNIARINEFAARSSILLCDGVTAQKYGQIKNSLQLKGRPIPENDIWIAAIALQYNFILVTRDQHFFAVEELLIEEW